MNFPPGFWLDLLQWLAMLALALIVWIRKPGEQAVEQIDKLRSDVDDRLSEISGNYIQLEERVKHLPTEREFRELTKQIGGQTEALNGLRRDLSRITDWIMQYGSKGQQQ